MAVSIKIATPLLLDFEFVKTSYFLPFASLIESFNLFVPLTPFVLTKRVSLKNIMSVFKLFIAAILSS